MNMMMMKAWERWLSILVRAKKSVALIIIIIPSRFSSSSSFSAPKGYFPVYVGGEKQRFVIKTQMVNHPLFKMLLQEAELEYGFSNRGPISLPCHVDAFFQVLAEIMQSGRRGKEYQNRVEKSTTHPPCMARFGLSANTHRCLWHTVNSN